MLLFGLVSIAANDPCCSQLEAKVEQLETLVNRQSAKLAEQEAALARTQDQAAQAVRLVLKLQDKAEAGEDDAAAAPASGVSVGAMGGTRARRLSANGSASGVAIGMHAWQTHVFPAGHSCPNLDSDRPKMLLPLTRNGSVTWKPNPTTISRSAPTLSLNSVATDWTTSEIQSFPAPFIIDHDASCASDPTLEVQLDTNVPSLTVGGVDKILRSNYLTYHHTCCGFGADLFDGASDSLDACLQICEAHANCSSVQWNATNGCRASSACTLPFSSRFDGDATYDCTGTELHVKQAAAAFEASIALEYDVHLGTFCADRNDLFDLDSTVSLAECMHKCQTDDTCISFEFSPRGLDSNGDTHNYCSGSTSCVIGRHSSSSFVTALFVKRKATAWQAITMESGYATTGSEPLEYMLKSGVVHLRGSITADAGTFGTTADLTIGTVPLPAIPKAPQYFLANAFPDASGFARVTVASTTGIMKVLAGNGATTLHLDGSSYSI